MNDIYANIYLFSTQKYAKKYLFYPKIYLLKKILISWGFAAETLPSEQFTYFLRSQFFLVHPVSSNTSSYTLLSHTKRLPRKRFSFNI